MMTPGNFTKAVIPKGTTTVITDPHEIGNVWGIEECGTCTRLHRTFPCAS